MEALIYIEQNRKDESSSNPHLPLSGVLLIYSDYWASTWSWVAEVAPRDLSAGRPCSFPSSASSLFPSMQAWARLKGTGGDGFHSPVSHPNKCLRRPDEKELGLEPGQPPCWKEPSLLSWPWNDGVRASSGFSLIE